MFNLQETATIGIFGHYGNQNMGDEAIVTAVIQNLRRRIPKANLVAFSLRPEDTTPRHGIPAYPIRHRPANVASFSTAADGSRTRTDSTNGQASRNIEIGTLPTTISNFLKSIPLVHGPLKLMKKSLSWPMDIISELRFLGQSYRILKEVDLLMITGSNQFLDNFGGPWGFPYTLLKWSVAARLAGTQVIYVSVGAGPIDSLLSKLFIRSALLFSGYTSFRDLASQKLIASMGFKGPSSVYPDLAYSLFRDDNIAKVDCPSPPKGDVTVGINVMPVYSNRYWCIHDNEKYEKYLQTLATFASSLIHGGYHVFFWGTQIRDEGAVEDAIARLDKDLGLSPESKGLVRTNRSVTELINTLNDADILVTTRFHGAVLSLYVRKAVLAVCYHPKTRDLMNEMGQDAYAMEFEELEANDLLRRFDLLRRNLEMEVPKISKAVEAYRASLDQQYDQLFGPPLGQRPRENGCSRVKVREPAG